MSDQYRLWEGKAWCMSFTIFLYSCLATKFLFFIVTLLLNFSSFSLFWRLYLCRFSIVESERLFFIPKYVFLIIWTNIFRFSGIVTNHFSGPLLQLSLFIHFFNGIFVSITILVFIESWNLCIVFLVQIYWFFVCWIKLKAKAAI